MQSSKRCSLEETPNSLEELNEAKAWKFFNGSLFWIFRQ